MIQDLVQDSLTAAIISKAVLISFGRRGHHADRVLILERTNFRTVSDLRSGTDGVIRVEEIDASPGGGGADAATNTAITIVIAIIIIVLSLVSIGV